MADSSGSVKEKQKSKRNKFNRKSGENHSNSAQRVNSENHIIKKRPSTKPYQRENDIYVTNKSDYKAQLQKCRSILDKEIGEVYLHSIGNAIRRCINLALTLVNESENAYGYEANTSTIELVDDFHPLNDKEDFAIQSRLNSCLHVRVFRHSNELVQQHS